MLKKQIVVTALTLLSGTLCIAVPGQTREQRALHTRDGLALKIEDALKAAHYNKASASVDVKEKAAEGLLALPHVSETYKQDLKLALDAFKTCNKNDTNEMLACANALDNAIGKAQNAAAKARQNPQDTTELNAIFDYHPGFFSDLSDAIDTPPAWVADTLNESKGARIAVFYTLAGYGVYKLYNWVKRTYEEHERERELIEQPAIIVVEP